MKKKEDAYEIPYSKIISAIKREFSRSNVIKEKYKSERIEKPNVTSTGHVSKRPLVFYKCNHCNHEFKQDQLQCDHIDPVVPIGIPSKHYCMDLMIHKTCFVDDINKLQLLCKPCHLVKSKAENAERREWKKKVKHIVYCTTNKVNWKKYIGVHKCVDLDDGYLGSGYALKAAITKHGKDKFYRKVLFCYSTEDEAYKKEKELVTDQTVLDPKYYNLSQGGRIPLGLHPSSLWKMRRARKGKESTSKTNIKTTATNLVTGESLEFNSIKQCAASLGLSYSAVLKVCKRRYGMSACGGWTFETDKYGKPLERKHKNRYVGITRIKNRYSVYFGSKYLGSFQTLKEAINAQSVELDLLIPKNTREVSFKNKYKISIQQAEKDIE